MAILDAFDILADKQTLTETSYTKFAKNLVAESDWGASTLPKYLRVESHGNFTLASTLKIALIGFNDDTNLSDEFVITSTEEIKQANITEGWRTFLQVPEICKKYKFITAKFIVGGSLAASLDEDDEENDGDLCTPPPYGLAQEPLDNTFTCAFVTAMDSGVKYPYANEDKDTI